MQGCRDELALIAFAARRDFVLAGGTDERKRAAATRIGEALLGR